MRIMCNNPLATRYEICSIADYNPNLQSRNATLCKPTNRAYLIYAALQPLQNDKVTLICCDKEFKNFDKGIFTCNLPEGKDFGQIAAGDILVEY